MKKVITLIIALVIALVMFGVGITAGYRAGINHAIYTAEVWVEGDTALVCIDDEVNVYDMGR